MIISSQIIEARERGKLTVKTGLCMHTSTPNANENHARTSAIASFSCPVEKLVLSPPSRSSRKRVAAKPANEVGAARHMQMAPQTMMVAPTRRTSGRRDIR